MRWLQASPYLVIAIVATVAVPPAGVIFLVLIIAALISK